MLCHFKCREDTWTSHCCLWYGGSYGLQTYFRLRPAASCGLGRHMAHKSTESPMKPVIPYVMKQPMTTRKRRIEEPQITTPTPGIASFFRAYTVLYLRLQTTQDLAVPSLQGAIFEIGFDLEVDLWEGSVEGTTKMRSEAKSPSLPSTSLPAVRRTFLLEQ